MFRRRLFISAGSAATCCLGNSAAASCLSNNVFDGDSLVLLASVLVSTAASSAASSCFDGDLLSRRSVVDDLLFLQFSSSILSQQRCLRCRSFGLAGFCVGVGGRVSYGNALFRRRSFVSAVSAATCYLGNSAAASCLSDNIFGGDLLVVLASVLVSTAASSAASSCFNGDLLSRRSVVDDLLSLQFSSSILSQQRCLRCRPFGLAGICVGVRGRVSCGNALFQRRSFVSAVSAASCCLGNSAAASCLSDNVFGGDPLVVLASVLVSTVASPATSSCFDGNLASRRSLGGDLLSYQFSSSFLSW